MKKNISILLVCLLLAACERKATITDWSPINDVGTPAATLAVPLPGLSTAVPETATSPTPAPTFDLNKMPESLPSSMKGYELVSWQEGDDWHFTLVTGTNREKTFEELMSPESEITKDGVVKITVTGLENIEKVLAKLPAMTEVFWSGMDLSGQVPEGTQYFSFPSTSTMNQLINFCSKHQVKLTCLAEPE